MMEMFTNTQPDATDDSLNVMNADGSLASVTSPWHAAVYPINTSFPPLVVKLEGR